MYFPLKRCLLLLLKQHIHLPCFWSFHFFSYVKENPVEDWHMFINFAHMFHITVQHIWYWWFYGLWLWWNVYSGRNCLYLTIKFKNQDILLHLKWEFFSTSLNQVIKWVCLNIFGTVKELCLKFYALLNSLNFYYILIFEIQFESVSQLSFNFLFVGTSSFQSTYTKSN